MDYGDAVKTLQGKGSAIQWGDDLGGEDETILTKMHEKPIFVMNYPRKAKAFYMKENPANPETVLCSDLLAPEGYGEIIGGLSARGHTGKAPGPDPRGEAAGGILRLVPRPSKVRIGPALGIRHRPGADPRLDLRQPAHQGVHPLPAHNLKDISVARMAEGRRAHGCAEGAPVDGCPCFPRSDTRRRYPLTAPPVSPATMYFCAKMKSSTAGIMARVR